MTDFTPPAPSLTWRLRGGFLAGALATVLFHQLTLALLWGLGVVPIKPFALTPTWPFGLPAVVSLTVWGGVWGMGLALGLPSDSASRGCPGRRLVVDCRINSDRS